MNREQVEVVKSTWAVLTPVRDLFVATLYRRLFELDAELARLFPPDLTEQKVKLTSTLDRLIDGLDHFEDLVPVLEDLGRRHVGYHVEEPHYRKLGSALLYALEKSLGNAWDPEVQGAWTALYSLLSQVMINGARKAHVA